MKLAILSYYTGLSLRGVESYVQDFCRNLEKNIDITVYQAGRESYQKETKNCKRIVIPFSYKPQNKTSILRRLYLDLDSLKIFLFTLKALFKMKHTKPDILMPVNNGWQSILCKLYSVFYHIPLILAGHAGFGQDDKLNIYLNPDVFIYFSNAQKTWAKKINPLCKTKVIHYGVDLSLFTPKKIKKTDSKSIILCVAALVDYKRVDLTIKACAKLAGIKLILVGNGNESKKREIKNLGQQLMEDRFVLTNSTYEQMPNIYRQADVFTLVSESQEAFGRVYLEAMASNLPIVATDDSQRREIIADAGIYVKNPEDISRYSMALQTALKTDFGNKPQKQAEKFSWDNIKKDYLELFFKLTND